MPTTSPQSNEIQSRDVGNWAQPVAKLQVSNVPSGAINLNVEGRQVVGPLQGFGQMWQKTYRVRLNGVQATPQQVVQAWKENFPKFQPPENTFYPSLAGIQPGEVVLINAMTPGGLVSTGVMVLYADAESFTLMTPEGHPESGWVTFSVFDEAGTITAQVQSIARANDPIYEAAFRVVGSTVQEKIWRHVLTALANFYGINAPVQLTKTLVDPKLQWSQAKNVWHNAQIRTLVYTIAAPVRWARNRLLKRQT